MAISQFSFPTAITFGPGARHLAKDHFLKEGIKNLFVVTDRALSQLAFFREFIAELERAGLKLHIFNGVEGNPVRAQVLAGVSALRAAGAEAILGIGGGAALDVAKAVALMLHHPGDIFDYEDGKADARPVDREIPPWFAIPTTAGTGSEVGRSTVIADDTHHVKKVIFSPRLMARAVFADPELTLELPPAVTAATGFDAMTHLIEAFLAKGYHPMADGIALEGLHLAARALPVVYKNGRDLAARSDMLMASMMGAVAFQKGLGIVHSCAHALSAVCGLHHGLANAVMIDHALPHNFEIAHEKFARLAQVAGSGDASSFIPWLSRLKAELGIAADLVALGISGQNLDALVAVASTDSCHLSNPAPVAENDFRKIFARALRQSL
ncbi:MAG: iron-containing alcohol dehydrogenase [Turneriella sp.]|nr:iron-containing alcohol dehydrogenase [Leptospiraceae bacterium]MCX7632612.1 iron-containing alcohol dehydrogenase [Turneriella sp.]